MIPYKYNVKGYILDKTFRELTQTILYFKGEVVNGSCYRVDRTASTSCAYPHVFVEGTGVCNIRCPEPYGCVELTKDCGIGAICAEIHSQKCDETQMAKVTRCYTYQSWCKKQPLYICCSGKCCVKSTMLHGDSCCDGSGCCFNATTSVMCQGASSPTTISKSYCQFVSCTKEIKFVYTRVDMSGWYINSTGEVYKVTKTSDNKYTREAQEEFYVNCDLDMVEEMSHYPEPIEYNKPIGAGNKCRNPDGRDRGLWCIPTNPNVTWQPCDIRLCTGK